AKAWARWDSTLMPAPVQFVRAARAKSAERKVPGARPVPAEQVVPATEADRLLGLQRTIGNHAVVRRVLATAPMLLQRAPSPPPKTPLVKRPEDTRTYGG